MIRNRNGAFASCDDSQLRKIVRPFFKGVVILTGWFCLIACYFHIYQTFENLAVPVSVAPFKDFEDVRWEQGYVYLAGSLASDSSDSRDKLPLQTSKIVCSKEDKTCRIATASVFDRQVSVDEDSYDIKEWTDRFIYFEDPSPICVTNYYTINRTAKSFEVVSKKKTDVTNQFCDRIPKEDKFISLKAGFDVWQASINDYENKNGIYFHLLLAVMNLVYLWLIAFLLKRQRRPSRVPMPGQ